jgi:hypothetical protein
LFEQDELLQYIEYLIEKGIHPVFHLVLDILLYEDFSNSTVSDAKIDILKQKVYKYILIYN